MRARLHKNGWTILSYVILTAAVLLAGGPLVIVIFASFKGQFEICLLYTSDAADE